MTDAAQVIDLPATTVVAGQVTVTPLIVGGGMTVTVAVEDLVGSWTLVALTVIDVPVVGAVRTPVEVIEPPEADQVTAEE